MRTTTVGPGGKYGGGKEARHTPQRLEGLARVVAKFQATNGEELKFELQRASGLEPTQVPVLEVIPPRKLLELGRTQFVLSAASRRCRRSRRRTHLGQLATCFAGSTTADLRQEQQYPASASVVALAEISAVAASGAIDAIPSDAERECAKHHNGRDRAIPGFDSVGENRHRCRDQPEQQHKDLADSDECEPSTHSSPASATPVA
jgi:hypothetical protein